MDIILVIYKFLFTIGTAFSLSLSFKVLAIVSKYGIQKLSN